MHMTTVRTTHRTWTAVIAFAILSVVVVETPANATPGSSVRDWNLNASNALFNPPAGSPPGAGMALPGFLHLAMVQGAVYDAVNAIDGGYEPYLEGLPDASPTDSVDAAVATAAHDVLVGLTNPQTDVLLLSAATRTWLDAARDASLAAIPDGVDKTGGIAIGAAAADAMLDARDDDGRFVPFSFAVGDDPGEWRPTPPGFVNDPFAWVAHVDPFLLESTSQFRTDGPNALSSAKYVADYNEVKELGSLTSTSRSAEQTAVALFYIENSIVMFNRTFRQIAEDEGLTPVEEARLFGTLNLVGADAVINCWDDKEFHGFWRPITAIRLGDDDTNDATEGDPTWTPLFPTPPGTPPYPDHPSGYNCITGSMMTAAKEFFGSNQMAFTVHSNSSGADRDYDRFTDVYRDTIDARVYLGIHFRTADVQGAVLGKKVAAWATKHYFQPVD
jgi:hypothetical protein